MTSSLVGSEMCIRDRGKKGLPGDGASVNNLHMDRGDIHDDGAQILIGPCLLYTSDAADDM
eukprot:6578900-Prorocentrum_lima.AAC.1